jgi:hypothetical protein
MQRAVDDGALRKYRGASGYRFHTLGTIRADGGDLQLISRHGRVRRSGGAAPG